MSASHKGILLLLVLVLFGGLFTDGLAQSARKLRVAVADFEVRGGSTDLGKSLADAFEAPLFRLGRFELYDRRQTQVLLQEVRFGQVGLTESLTRLKSKNIDILVTGTINIASSSATVNFRFLDVLSAQVRFADSAEASLPLNSQSIQTVANRLVASLSERFPLQGKITGVVVAEKQYLIDIGTGSNLKPGDEGIYSRVVNINGQQIPRSAGRFKVVEVNTESAAIIEVTEKGEYGFPKVGDPVSIVTADSAQLPSLPGLLIVRTTPPVRGAEVLLDGQSVGVIGANELQISAVTPGLHSVEIRATGYEIYKGSIQMPSGRTQTLEATLRAKPATLVITTNVVGASIFVNGLPRGSTNAARRLEIPGLAPGQYLVEVRAEGYEPGSTRIQIEPGQTVPQDFTLKPSPATLVLTLNPSDATVLLDGRPIGSGSNRIAPGRYNLEVRREGFVSQSLAIELKSGETVSRTINLVAQPATLRLVLNPKDATVLVNGEVTQGTSLNLPAGNYRLEVRREGYTPQTFSLELRNGQTLERRVDLAPLPGSLTVRVNPSNARVLLDGRAIGSTVNNLAPGSYKLEVILEGYASRSEVIQINPGQAVTRTIDLTALPAVLNLTIEPQSAKVLLDGESTANRRLTLSPGTYTIEVSQAGYKSQTITVSLSAGANVTRTVSLEAIPATLNLVVEPSDAQVRLNGNPVSGDSIELKPGSYRLEVSHDGYQTQTLSLNLSPGQNLRQEVRLQQLGGILILEGVPTSARVTLNGEVKTGSRIEVPPGRYRVQIELAGYSSYDEQIVLRAGEAVTLRAPIRAFAQYVSPRGTPSGVGSRESPLSLTTAVGRAGPGTPLVLMDGIYKISGLRLPVGMVLRAENGNQVIFEPEGGNKSGLMIGAGAEIEGVLFRGYEVALSISGGNTKLNSVRFEGNNRALLVSGGVVSVETGTLVGNGSGRTAIRVESSGVITLSNSTISNSGGGGILVTDNASATITGSIFRDNGATATHLEVAGRAKAEVRETEFAGSRFSIRVFDSASGSACQSKNKFTNTFLPQLQTSGKFDTNC